MADGDTFAINMELGDKAKGTHIRHFALKKYYLPDRCTDYVAKAFSCEIIKYW